MALTTCGECGGKVSDKALKCPHCGYPLLEQVKDYPATGERNTSTTLSPTESTQQASRYPGTDRPQAAENPTPSKSSEFTVIDVSETTGSILIRGNYSRVFLLVQKAFADAKVTILESSAPNGYVYGKCGLWSTSGTVVSATLMSTGYETTIQITAAMDAAYDFGIPKGKIRNIIHRLTEYAKDPSSPPPYKPVATDHWNFCSASTTSPFWRQ